MYSASMNTKLFNTHEKKLVIGSNLSFVDTYLKDIVKKQRKPILNIEKASVGALAKTIVVSFIDKDVTFVSTSEGRALMHSFLMSKKDGKDIYGLIPDASFSLKTSSMVFDNIIQIRNGKVIKPTKVDQLIKDFEQYLLDKNLLDDSLTLRFANDYLSKVDPAKIKESLNMNDVSLFVFDELNEMLNYQESLFISNLENVYKIKREIIEIENKDSIVEKFKVNAYGFANEVNYVINHIKSEKLNLNDVAIYVTDDSYTNLIKGLFEIYGINYAFTYSTSALNNNVISFINNVIKFHASHYSIIELHNIYKNPIFINKEDKDVSNLQYLRSNLDQIKFTVNNSYMGQIQKDFLMDLLSLDQTKDIPSIYAWLIEFTKRNVDEESFTKIEDSLNSLTRYFEFTNLGDISFEDKLSFILESLMSISYYEYFLKENESCVEIYKLRSSLYLSKKYNFFLGLSARQFQVKEIDFPLISDKDLAECLDNSYYVSYVNKANLDLINNVNKLISTLSNGEIYFIKSEYDSNEFKSLSASAFYLNVDAKEIEKSYNVYKENKLVVNSNNDVAPLLYPNNKKDLILSSVDKFTPSKLEKLLNCPIDYCCSLFLDDFSNLFEYGDTWLDGGGDFGTITHEILEIYLPDHDQKFDVNALNKVFDDTYKKYSESLHFDQESKKKAEFYEIKETVLKYLDKFYKSQENLPYSVLFTELEFSSKRVGKDKNVKLGDIEYKVNNTLCKFHGVIDRVDGYIDEDNKLHLRFIDYKTTGEKSFKDKEKHLKLSQAVIYPEVIPNLIKLYKKEIEQKIGKQFNDVDLSDLTFFYELLTFDSQSEFVYKGEKYLKQKEFIDKSIDRLMNVISLNDFNLFMNEYEVETCEISGEHDNSKCKYCAYKSHCPLKIELGGNKGWLSPKE